MSCNCGKPDCGCEKKTCGCGEGSCSCGKLPKAIELPGRDMITTFHKVIIPASIGDETTYPPVPGLYRNVFAVYESSGEGYLYSTDGIPTKITDKAELKRLETLLGNEVAERKEADAELEEKIETIKGLRYEIVETLPETGEAGIIYLVPKTSEAPDFYDEYLWVNNAFEKIGSTEVDLDGYVKKEEIFHSGLNGAKDGINITPAKSSTPASASNGGIAIGAATSATSSDATAVGYNASAYNGGKNAFGVSAAAYNGGLDAFGSNAYAQTFGRAYAGGNAANSSLAIGPGAESDGTFSIAVNGYRSAITGHDIQESKTIAKNGGLAIGYGAEADNARHASDPNMATAIGHNAKSTNGGYEAIGADSSASDSGRAYAGGIASGNSTAFGGTASGASVAFFGNASATGLAIGTINKYAVCSEGGVEAIGANSVAKSGGRAYAGGNSSNGSIAVGGTAVGGGSLTFGLGASATAEGAGGVAIGVNALSSNSGAVSIGSSAKAKGSGSVAIGPSSVADEAGTVSFGVESSTTKIKRRLVNIAPGQGDFDAVAMLQLNALSDRVDGLSMAKAPNVTILGEPTLNNGQASDFSAFDYLQFPFILDLTGKTIQIDFCFTTGDDVTTQQNVIDSKYGIALAIQNGHGLMAVSSNGQSWDIGTATGTFTIAANTTYFARLSWDGATYRTDISYDGQSFTKDMSIESVYPPFPTTHYIGGANSAIVGHTTHPFGGIIDLNKSKMIINDELVWEGMDSLGLRTRADVSLSNIDAAGEEKIREVMAPIIGNIEAILAELNSGEGV